MLSLPTTDNRLEPYALSGTPLIPRAPHIELTRTAFAAAHVVSDPRAERNPWESRPAVDWEATLQVRIGLWDQGLGLAEAMDTAQRGMGVDWETAKELIQRTLDAAREHSLKPRVACGAGTDHVALSKLTSADAIKAAYGEQMSFIEKAGGQIILMASRAFTALGCHEETYHEVYRSLIDSAQAPVILHWLGDMFDPALSGYWGHSNIQDASDFVHKLIAENPEKVDGIKISLLDQTHEEAFRARLPKGVRLYTGDDFNYPALIAGDGKYYSHALLGIFAAIAPAASQALEALALGNKEDYDQIFSPTLPLAQEIFRAPTRFYKAGIAFMSWLNGAQRHFIMPSGFQSSRHITHYAQVFRLADQAGMLRDPNLAQHRMKVLLDLHGID